MRLTATRCAALCCALLLLTCGPGQNSTTDGMPVGDGQVSDGQVSDGDGGAVSDAAIGDVDAGPPLADFCQLQCAVASDCSTGQAPYDADNYQCNGGRCVYTGCNDNGECQTLGDFVCHQADGQTMSFCQVACVTPADCNGGSAPYDADNYQCDNGACEYTGCNGDAECQAIGNYLCRPIAGSSLNTCQKVCATAADCDSGSAPFDEDNYQCPDGICKYTGCNDNAECQTLGDYVCAPAGG